MYKIIPDRIFLRQIKRFDSSARRHIREKINTLKENPSQNKSLSVRGANAFRMRITINRKDFRLVYTLENDLIKLICIEERHKVYNNLMYYMKKARYKLKEKMYEYRVSLEA